MEYLLIIVVLIGGIWIFFKLRPTKPLYRDDIEPKEGNISLSDGKKILKQYLKENPEHLNGYRDGFTKSEINELIRDDIEDFADTAKQDLEDLKDEIEGLEEELQDAEEDDIKALKENIEELKQAFKRKDISCSVLFSINHMRGIDPKTNRELQARNYTKK